MGGRLTALMLLVTVSYATASYGTGDPVRVYEGKKTILTGPYDERVAPQKRPGAFSPVDYPAVFVENDYFAGEHHCRRR